GNVRYALTPRAMGQWHMVVATFDSERHTRALYWDGVLVASDGEGGKAGKISQFTIGASSVWTGRWFEGGIDEAAVWNKSFTAEQVAGFYSAAGQVAPASSQAPAASPSAISTNAEVEIEDANGKIPLKPAEKVALMFLTAFQSIELDCVLKNSAACTMDQM